MEGGRGHSARIRSTLRLNRAETGSTLSHLEGGLSGRRYEADALIDCLRKSGGGAVAVPERDIVETQGRLGRLGLGYASLETAAAAAGLKMLMESRVIEPEGRVVLFDTGAGFKSEPPVIAVPRPIPNDVEFWKERVIPGLR